MRDNKDPAATSQIDSSLAACGMIPASVPLSNTCPDVVQEILSVEYFIQVGSGLDCERMVLADCRKKKTSNDDSQMVAAWRQTPKTSLFWCFLSDLTLHAKRSLFWCIHPYVSQWIAALTQETNSGYSHSLWRLLITKPPSAFSHSHLMSHVLSWLLNMQQSVNTRPNILTRSEGWKHLMTHCFCPITCSTLLKTLDFPLTYLPHDYVH